MMLPQIVRALLIFVVMTSVDCRAGSRGKGERVRVSNVIRNKLPSLSIHRPSPFPYNHGGVAGLLALRSFVSKIQPRRPLINGTGNLCINRENYSNFIFNEFRCPLTPIFSMNNRYCCGSHHHQYCCSFWESIGRTISLTIGVIFAASVGIILIICFIFY